MSIETYPTDVPAEIRLESYGFTASNAEHQTAFRNVSVEDGSHSTALLGRCKWNSLNTGMTFLLFLTFALNLMSSTVLFRVPLISSHGKSNPVYFCIRFLNVCDVLQAFFLILMPAFATSDCGWLGGKLSCSIMGFIVLFFLLVSPLITILMAFDRVVALYWPFKYRSQLGLKMLKVLLPSACIFVLVTAVLPIFGVGDYHVVKGRRFCLLDTITDDSVSRSYVIAVHVIFLLALVFMLSCTIAFQTKLANMSFTKKHKESKSKNKKKKSSRRTRNATLTTMAVCCIFIVCYLPYVIRVLIEASTLKKSPRVITWMTFGLAFLQPLLNPIVYIGTNARYRQELRSMIRNIKVSEWETSSESGTTHHGSRGPLSGFRRRLSSGSSRNSKRGSKRKHFENKNSLNNSAASPPVAHSHGNGVDKRANCCPKQSRSLPFIPDNCVPQSNVTTRMGASPKADDDDKYCEPSSSSGVKSYDSVERMLLTAPAMASHLAFQISGNHKESIEYGRSSRVHFESFRLTKRERSNTVSGAEKPQLSSIVDRKSQSLSTPTLLNDGDCRDKPADALGLLTCADGSSNVLRYHHSPMKWSHHEGGLPDVTLDASADARLMEDGKEGSNESSGSAEAHCTAGPDTQVKVTFTQNSSRSRSSNRPSYKRALDLTSRYLLSRKPSKRDSGVGDS